MTVKYVDGVVARNANVTAPRRIAVYDDGGIVQPGTVPEAAKAYVTEAFFGNGLCNRSILTCTALPISVADDAGQAQYGGVKVYTFPQGIVRVDGAMYYGSLTMGATGTFIDEYTGVMALGSVTASTGNTLVSTEATWVQSTAMATAAVKVAVTNNFPVATQVTESGARWYDGHTTAGPVWLNVAIADDATHTAGTGTWTGTIIIDWTVMGDY